jgi:hypothetical protein
VDQVPIDGLERHFSQYRQGMINAANQMPSHAMSISNASKMKAGAYPAAPQSLYGIKA